ncbi:MAG: tetraacyldisaccharide 4'-kinase [Acidobacteriota bacterium]|nr:tetraacyldisaccharide 4'-kinase [Acidobacteriota bacterium]
MFSRIHEAVLQKRIALYEKGVFESFSLGAFTVSVGNLTVGGTGKTPLVTRAAEILTEMGETVCIVTRGYKRENPKARVLVSDGEKILADAKQAGDEPFELARKLLGRAIVIADANRIAAGNWAREKFRITAFVLDDAFQHLRARRDLDIVTIDATNPYGNGKLFPFGILREPLQNLKRADAIVITRANLVEAAEDLKTKIRRFNANCPIFVSENKTARLTEIKEFLAKANCEKSETPNSKIENQRPKTKDQIETESKYRFLAFCGLGNPNNFFAQLRGENFDLAATETFPDHYFYKQNDIVKLEKKARPADAGNLLTTAKDAVKLKDLNFDLPCFVAESEMVFAGGDDFRNWIISKLKQSKQK